MPLYETGQWEPIVVTDSQTTAIHAHLLHTGKIIYFHARYVSFNDWFMSCLYDPGNPTAITQPIIPAWPDPPNEVEPQNIFCSGHTFLSDGTLFVAGGERPRPPFLNNSWRGLKYSYKFNGTSWSTAQKMNWGRWYPQLTRLPDGKVVAMSGYSQTDGGIIVEIPEAYNPLDNTWTLYDNAVMQIPLYNGAYIIPFGIYAGEIFYDLIAWGGAMSQGKRFNPSMIDVFRWNDYGGPGTARDAGNSCMLPIRNTDSGAYIVNVGGSNIQATVIEIGNDANPNPQWIKINMNMFYLRQNAPNFLLLADGTPVVFGGANTKIPEKLDYSDPNPKNWTWSQILPPVETPVWRRYHSTALLQPDARVWTGGSRLDFGGNEFEADMERRIQIYSPGYLFDGSRPQIDNAPDIINYAPNPFQVNYSGGTIDSVVLISLPSVTHCFDANQKYVILDFVELSPGILTVTPPLNANIAQPGPYMLFLLRIKSESTSGTNRIPSVAKIVLLQQ